MDSITIDRRFRGPATSGNGGYVCGRLAAFIDGPATVSLKRPPPLETPLSVRREGDRVLAFDQDVRIAEAVPARLEVSIPAVPDARFVDASREAYLAGADQHVLPECFVCGPRRVEGDGLRLFAGLAPGAKITAAAWTPTQDLADADGIVRAEFLWAALDCPSAFALGFMGELVLLASLTAKVTRRPRVGEALTVLAWPDRSEGRKHFAYSAVVSKDNEEIAVAHALWIEVNDPELRKKLLAENR